jgi:hypothetical protein
MDRLNTYVTSDGFSVGGVWAWPLDLGLGVGTVDGAGLKVVDRP